MKNRRYGLLLLVCLLIVCLVSGCKKNPPKPNTKEGTLKVVLCWDEFDKMQQPQQHQSIQEMQLMGAFNVLDFESEEEEEDTSVVTHTGVRVVYPEDNAAYSQSVTREVAETQGIITLQIPSTDDAEIYLLAVHYSEKNENKRALWMGYIESFPIPPDSITTITMNQIDWIEATWYPGEGYEDFENGLVAPKNEKVFWFPIYVRDPFQVGQDVSYEKSIFKISGRSSCWENVDGWRRFDISHWNSDIGVPHTETYSFQPGIDYLLFNLPDGRYNIAPIVTPYVVTWE